MMIKRIHSIGIAVRGCPLSSLVNYYTQTAGFREVARTSGTADEILSVIFAAAPLPYTTVTLDARTTYLELTEFALPYGMHAPPMPVNGPGITHVCYQSPAATPAYERFKGGATRLISRGERPIDLAGAGITYAYARDPAGNIFEMEQMDTPPYSHPLWMGHVALVTHDIERLTTFYGVTLLGQAQPPAHFRFANNPRLDDVADLDGVDLKGAWVRGLSVQLEFWEYLQPPTPIVSHRGPPHGYYSINFEVDDVQAEYERLQAYGVQFAAPPLVCAGVTQVYGFDPDGNVFQLRSPA